MNIILGFGKTEEDFEKQEFDFCDQFIKSKRDEFKGDKYDFQFIDEMVSELKAKLKARADEYRRLDEQYKTATDYPDRYSTYYFNILHDIHDICVIFDFSHINRRHAMSPDGWALLSRSGIYHANVWDYRD